MCSPRLKKKSKRAPRLKRTAFFPGGYGLTAGAKKRDSIKVIVVGRDFVTMTALLQRPNARSKTK
jgi:hypothetical protein